MKKITKILSFLIVVLLLNACSSVKVLSSWKADNASTIKDNNILVIARTANLSARMAFENEIVKQLVEDGIKATASFTKFPKLNPDEKVSEEKKEAIVNMLKSEGYNGVILTVIKDVQELSKTDIDGGYYAGGTMYGYYPRYYGGFYGYYNNPMSYSTFGNYVPQTATTYTATNYVLETVIYDLEQEGEKQLVAIVTSKLEEPDSAEAVAKQYVKAITKSLDKK